MVSATLCLNSALVVMSRSQSFRVAARMLGRMNMLSVGVMSSTATSFPSPSAVLEACHGSEIR